MTTLELIAGKHCDCLIKEKGYIIKDPNFDYWVCADCGRKYNRQAIEHLCFILKFLDLNRNEGYINSDLKLNHKYLAAAPPTIYDRFKRSNWFIS